MTPLIPQQMTCGHNNYSHAYTQKQKHTRAYEQHTNRHVKEQQKKPAITREMLK